MGRFRRLLALPSLAIGAGIVLLAVHLYHLQPELDDLLPSTVHEYRLDMSFEGFGGDVGVFTYLPGNDERQRVLEEHIESGTLLYGEQADDAGRKAGWKGPDIEGPRTISYSALISAQGVRYEIPAGLKPTPSTDDALAPYLAETKAIPFRHAQIQALWGRIKPRESGDLLAILRAIHHYTYSELEPAPFKGFTDALTALRLGEASCNGKSRLFVALARLNGIPARLVGGVILTPGAKRTSHQWVEVWIGERWVPFCPLNNHFAEIPATYLRLYRGDEFLFSHTRDINFDYAFRVRRLLSVQPGAAGDAAELGRENRVALILQGLGLNHEFSMLFLLFPVAALVVTFCRNIVGMRTFGVFLPMLVAAGCRYTGLVIGLAGFLGLMVLGAATHRLLRGMRVLMIPRVAAVMTLITGLIVVSGVVLADLVSHRVAFMALFPVVILSFAAERLQQMVEHRSFADAIKSIFWTLLVTILCYLAFRSALLQGLMFNFPEALLIVMGVQLAIGSWTGIRAFEYGRFARLFRAAGKDGAGVLGINARNIDLIARLNEPQWILTANDKVATKRCLEGAGVLTPRMLAVLESELELHGHEAVLRAADGFALKPAQGSGGNGILLLRASEGDSYRLISGEAFSREQLRAHVRDITQGLFGDSDEPDCALFECLIEPDGFSRSLYERGIADIRVLLARGEPVAAMLRVPTHASGGKANLHQGGAGFGIELDSGRLLTGIHFGRILETHPDTGARLTGAVVPRWASVLDVARAAQRAVPLGYAGVDICLDRKHGPMVLEINARPGIEIQNALQGGLLPQLEGVLAAPAT